jgi:hypothetical protein
MWRTPTWRPTWTTAGSSWPQSRWEGVEEILLDRKDVTDSYEKAYLDNCRILMTSVKVRGVRRYCWIGRMWRTPTWRPTWTTAGSSWPQSRWEGVEEILLDRKDVTDSYEKAYLDNCRILMTSVKVRGGWGDTAGQEGCDGLLHDGLPGQLQDPHDLSQGERGAEILLDRKDVTDSYMTAYQTTAG